MSSTAKNQSGKTFVENGKVVWEYNTKRIVEVPIDQIKLIAEYTNDWGPWWDDWYLVIYNRQSQYFEISMYAEGHTEMMTHLGESLGIELSIKLINSADWKSNILYPEQFNGKELWVPKEVKPKSFLGKIKALFGSTKIELILTETAKEILG